MAVPRKEGMITSLHSSKIQGLDLENLKWHVRGDSAIFCLILLDSPGQRKDSQYAQPKK